MGENEANTSIKWVFTIAIIVLVAYQVYNGIALKKLGIPGVFEVEFGEQTNSNNSSDTIEDILGRD